MVKKEFRVYSPLSTESVKEFTKAAIKKSNDGDSGERILLEGIASTTSRDLHDEIVAADAIESMAEQAIALNIHADHWYGVEDVIGAIKDASVEDKKLHIKFLITKKHTPDIKDLLDTGVNLGLSIGGYVTNYDEKNRIINAIELYEISLTPMPANWDTFGTVTTSKGLVQSNCLSGACYAIVKTLEENNDGDKTMVSKSETHKEEEESSGLTRDDVIQLFNELMAEKEETIAQEITEKVESQLESIVDAKIAEALDEEKPAEEEETPEEETKATEEEDEEETPSEEDEDEEEDKTKSNDPTIDISVTNDLDIADIIGKSIENALGDDFADKVAAKMFGDLDKTRTTKGSKYKQFQESMKSQEEDGDDEDKVEKTTYSTKETAEILLRKQKAANPIMAAALKNLE